MPPNTPRRSSAFRRARNEVYIAAPLDGAAPIHLVFGGETRGLPEALRKTYADALYSHPACSAEHVRSLNLSNAVSIAVYETLRRRGTLEMDR